VIDATEFRALFPALRQWVWLDTPGSAPLATPVRERFERLLADWSAGEFDWLDWDAAAPAVRERFAHWLGVPAHWVAVLGSAAEGVAAVAGGLPPGRVVVGDAEFRSVLLPWLALDQRRNPVVRVTGPDGAAPATVDLAAAVTPGTALVAVSEVLSADGARHDLALLRRVCDRVGARLLVDGTQSVGVLPPFTAADHLVVHGYKWLLCPRGVGFLVSRPERHGELRPPLPSWKTPPGGYFGGVLSPPPDATAVDTTPAWPSWLAAGAAVELLTRLPAEAVARHCLDLARATRAGAAELGYRVLTPAEPADSHILVLAAENDADTEAVAAACREHRVRAGISGGRVRLGFHYFNDATDVATVLAALRVARGGLS
jgi:selenocysteine lyase/cysteine desulfurase